MQTGVDPSYAPAEAAWDVRPHGRAVPAGPRAYRTRIRTLGGPLALVPPAVLGLLSWLMLHNNESTSRGIGGYIAAMLAAPLLPVAGAPMRSPGGAYVLAVVGSGLLWMLTGLVAGRRATRAPIATWRNFWSEWVWLATGIWVGVVVALVASNLVLGRTLF